MWKEGPADYQKIYKKGNQWRDPDFPIGVEALFWADMTNGRMEDKADMIDSWKRLYYQYPDTTLFGNSDYTNDVGQGMLGDCYFLASCVAFAESDQRFHKIWLQQEHSESGIYAVNAYIRGKKSVLVVDDYMPFMGDYPIFAKLGYDGSIWGPILEKAFAKYMVNYENIQGGFEPEAFNFLTGAPSILYALNMHSAEEMWALVKEANNSGFIMAAGTQPGGGDTVNNEYGLAYNHAYTVLSCHEIKDDNGKVQRLYRIRNPWRRDGLYKGMWRDSDSHWTQTLKSQVPFNDMDDGIFYVSYRDFMDAFGSITICHYHDDWVHSTFDVLDVKKLNKQIEFTIPKTLDLYIIFDFYDPRMYPDSCKKKESEVFITLLDEEDNVLTKFLTADLFDGMNFIGVKNMKKGKYIADINVFWDKSDVKDYTFRIYAPIEIQIQEAKQKHIVKFDKSEFQYEKRLQSYAQLLEYSHPHSKDLKTELIDLIEGRESISQNFKMETKSGSWYKVKTGISKENFNDNSKYKFLFILESNAKTENKEYIDLDLEMFIEFESKKVKFASTEIGSYCKKQKQRVNCLCEIRHEEGKSQCAILLKTDQKIDWGFSVKDFKVRSLKS